MARLGQFFENSFLLLPFSMPAYPTGVITLVFTDIEGSSALWETHLNAFAPVLDAHNHLLREATAKWRGVEVKTEGDAFFLVFASASDAVSFAVEAQLALKNFDWSALLPDVHQLRVRMGMHSGEPILATHPNGDVDYFGPVVNRAARVGGAGYGGQVLVSQLTRQLAQAELSSAIGFENLGQHRLKGVGEEELWQVTHDELPVRFPALKTMAVAKHNLPPAQTQFIGRETEVAQWSALLREPDIRLLTLCGFGGQGKTRLSQQIAENVIEDFADGVWWIELELARDADAMIARIAHELRLHLLPQSKVREQLCDFVRERELLLVLDNTEQLPDAGAVVAELLSIAPRLKCLVTTRRALEIRAERVVWVQPLPLSESVELFAQRGSSRVEGFAVTPGNRGAIEELCRALEGVPLAIELAASRLSVLSPGEIVERLDERFRLLQTRAPDLPGRQRALRGAIDWSFDLLNEADKELLCMLSVFAGGFSLSAAEVVSDDFDSLEGVAELTRHSFLRGEEIGGVKRFTMLESVRAYAAEKLDASSTLAREVRQRHARYFLNLAERCAKKLRTCDEATALDLFWIERANFDAALRFANDEEPALCSRLALAGHESLYRLGLWEDSRATLRMGLAALPTDSVEGTIKASMQLGLASLAHDMGEEESAQHDAELALNGAQKAHDTEVEANALNLLGLLAIDRDDMAAARVFFEDSLAKRATKNENGRAVALHNLAMLAARSGELKEAEQRYNEALKHRRSGGDARGEAETLGNLGVLSHKRGDLALAEQLYSQSLSIRRTLRDRMGIALMLHNLGEIAAKNEDFRRAILFFTHSERLFREVGSNFADSSAEELENLRIRLGEEYNALRAELVEVSWESEF